MLVKMNMERQARSSVMMLLNTFLLLTHFAGTMEMHGRFPITCEVRQLNGWFKMVFCPWDSVQFDCCSLQVICEGFKHREDKLKLRGSCGLEYSLHFKSGSPETSQQSSPDVAKSKATVAGTEKDLRGPRGPSTKDPNTEKGAHATAVPDADGSSMGILMTFLMIAAALAIKLLRQQAEQSAADRLHYELRRHCSEDVLPHLALVETVKMLRGKGVTAEQVRSTATGLELERTGMPPAVVKSILLRRTELAEQARAKAEQEKAEAERQRAERARVAMRDTLSQYCSAELLSGASLTDAAEMLVAKGVTTEQVRTDALLDMLGHVPQPGRPCCAPMTLLPPTVGTDAGRAAFNGRRTRALFHLDRVCSFTRHLSRCSAQGSAPLSQLHQVSRRPLNIGDLACIPLAIRYGPPCRARGGPLSRGNRGRSAPGRRSGSSSRWA